MLGNEKGILTCKCRYRKCGGGGGDVSDNRISLSMKKSSSIVFVFVFKDFFVQNAYSGMEPPHGPIFEGHCYTL